MNSDIAISVKNLSKYYTLKKSSNTFRNYLSNLYRSNPSKEIQVLKDISFDIQKGECVGIIGSNGAGKSTLLKILSKIVWPSSGTIQMNGKLSAMLEVGTGFYPDLTGRENIYLSGAFLGMTKRDIDLHLDDIIDFAGVGSYIDSPVRYYSSGMYVRLGFSVASFLKQEILIIDEILAVGDRKFRERCVSAMQDDSINKGKTCLIVSHNIPMIKSLCATTILLKKGEIKHYGQTSTAVESYFENDDTSKGEYSNRIIQINSISLNDESSASIVLGAGDNLIIKFSLTPNKTIKSLLLRLQIRQGDTNVAVLNNTISNNQFNHVNGKVNIECNIPRLNLNCGLYTIDLDISDYTSSLLHLNKFVEFEIDGGFYFASSLLPNPIRGACLIDHSWNLYE